VGEFLLHLGLLEFVTAKDDEAAGFVLRNRRLDEVLAKAARGTGDQDRFFRFKSIQGLRKVAQHARLGRRRGSRDGESERSGWTHDLLTLLATHTVEQIGLIQL